MCFLWIIYTGLILRSIATEVTSTHIPHRHFLKCTIDSQWTLPRWVTKSASSVRKWPSNLYATTMRLPFSLLRASTHQGLPALNSFGDTLTQKHKKNKQAHLSRVLRMFHYEPSAPRSDKNTLLLRPQAWPYLHSIVQWNELKRETLLGKQALKYTRSGTQLSWRTKHHAHLGLQLKTML